MAKIQVTESELRDTVHESVVAVLNEGNFGMNWNQLTPKEQQKFANRYYNWNLGNFFKNGFNKQAIDPADVQQRYQTIQARKQKNGNATLSQAQGQRLQQQIAALKKSAQMAEIAFQRINTSLDSLISANQPAQPIQQQATQPLEEAENQPGQALYTDNSTTDAQGNTETVRTYNDNYNFAAREQGIITKLETLKQNINAMKAAYDKEINKWKGYYNTLKRQQGTQQQPQPQATQQRVTPATVSTQRQEMPNPTALASTQKTTGLAGQRPGRATM